MDKNIIYLTLIFLGFAIPTYIFFRQNKENKLVKKEDVISSFVIFILAFFTFAKFGNIIIEKNYIAILNNDENLNVFVEYIRCVLSGYTFITGYVGSILSIILYSKLSKINSSVLLNMYAPILTLMYGILKLGCFVKGCCGSHYIENIQLIEGVISIVTYVCIYRCDKLKNKGPIFLILYGITRGISSIFKIYKFTYTLILIEVMCIGIVGYGLYSYFNSKKLDKFSLA